MSKVILLNGSAHQNGHTAEALNKMIRIFNENGIESVLYQVGSQAIRGCMDCNSCQETGKCVFQDDAVNEVAAELETADGLIVGSPVYFNSPSGTILSFLDRLFRVISFPMDMKVGACVVTTESSGRMSSIDTLNQYFAMKGMKIASVSFWNQDLFNSSEESLAQNVSEMVKALSESKLNGSVPEIEETYVTDFSEGDFEKLRKRPLSVFILNEETPIFPDPRYASETGLLAVGGDGTVEWLVEAYKRGIFPWTEEGLPLLWFAPSERFVLVPSELNVPKKIARLMRNHEVTLQLNRDFADTMHRCRTVREKKGTDTWIDDDVEQGYMALYDAGYAFSAEVFIDGELAGGCYGVKIDKCLSPESGFNLRNDGLKIAVIMLAKYMEEHDYRVINFQVPSSYLMPLGAKTVEYETFMRLMHPDQVPEEEN